MALVFLGLLYLALATALAVLAGFLGRPWGRADSDSSGSKAASGTVSEAAPVPEPGTAGRRWPPLFIVLVLTLLPLFFTVAGFLPNQTLAPTPLLEEIAPWAEPYRAHRMSGEGEPNPLLLDPLSQFIPWREAARRDWLLNPSQGAGSALLGNGQSAVLYPTEILARALPPFRAVTFSQAARLLVAGWGMFLLALTLLAPQAERRSSPRTAYRAAPGLGDLPAVYVAALGAAGVWMGCGFFQVWRLHPHTLVAATVPWILWALVWLVRRPGPAPAVGLAVVGAVAVTAGHPETLFHALLFGLAIAALVVWSDRHGTANESAGAKSGPASALRALFGPAQRSIVGWGLASALLAALLAAPLLLPFIENLRVSSEWLLRRDAGTVVEAPLDESLQRLRPTFALYALGDPRVDAEEAVEGGYFEPWAEAWGGPENLAELAGGWTGAVALLLAFLALGHPDRRLRRLARGVFAVGVVGLLVSIHLPILSRPFGEIPLLRESLLKRLSLGWSLSISLGAGIGLMRWLRSEVYFFRAPLWSAAAAALAVSLASAGPFRTPAAITVGEWVPLLVAGAVLCLVPDLKGGAKRLIRERAAVLTVLVALLAPPVFLLGGWIPTSGSSGFYPDTGATRFVAARLAESGPVGYRVSGLNAAMTPHSATFFNFADPRVYDPMVFAPYADFLVQTRGVESGPAWAALTDPAAPQLAFLGVRYLFEHPHSGPRDGTEIAYRDAGAVVYENPRALPRVYVPETVEAYWTWQEAVAASAGVEDFAHRVTVSGLDLGQETGKMATRESGPARLRGLEVSTRAIHATVAAEAAALVATSQPAIPGWRVRLNGEEVETVAVNGAFLGVVVGPGEHRVEMEYAPATWRWGLGLAALGSVLSLALVWSGRRRASTVAS